MYYQCEVCKIKFKVAPARHKRALKNPKQFTPRACSMACSKIRLKGIRRSPNTQFTSERTSGENSNKWKGDKVGYSALHDWIRRQLGTPKVCENCGSTNHKQYEWANISGEYKRDTSDWARLCKMCHHLIDGSMRGLNRKGGTVGRKWKS